MKENKIVTTISITEKEKAMIKELAWKNRKSMSKFMIDKSLE